MTASSRTGAKSRRRPLPDTCSRLGRRLQPARAAAKGVPREPPAWEHPAVVRFRVLGPLEVTDPDGDARGRRRRQAPGAADPAARRRRPRGRHRPHRQHAVGRRPAADGDRHPAGLRLPPAPGPRTRPRARARRRPCCSPGRPATCCAPTPRTWTCCASPSWSRTATARWPPATRPAASRCSTRRWRCGGASRWPSSATCRPSTTDRLRLAELHVRARERRCDALLAVGPARRRRHRPAAPGRRAPAARAAVGPAGHRPLRRRPAGRGPRRPAAAAPSCCATSSASTRARSCATSSRPCCARTRSCSSGCPARCCRPRPRRRRPRVARAPRRSSAGGPSSPTCGRSPSRSRAGRAAVVVLEGEAGIGKTRLAEAAAEAGRAAGWSVAWSRCADDAGAPALWPWTQVLEQLGQEELTPLSAADGDDADAARFRLFQDLRARLTTAAADRAGARRPRRPAGRRHRRRCSCSACWPGTCRGRRSCWWSPRARSASSCPRRSPTAWPGWPASQPPTCLRLTGLDADDVAALLTAQLGSPGDRSLASAVHDRTGGNPFFVVELSRWMVGAHDLHLDRVPVPPSVGEVLRTRLDRLPAATREVLELAAVAGREVDAGPARGRRHPRGGGADRAGLRRRRRPGRRGQPAVELAVHPRAGAGGAGRRPARRCGGRGCTPGSARRSSSGSPATPDDALVERLAHHFVEALPVAGPAPARRYSTARRRARPGPGWPTARRRRTPGRRCSCSTRPSPTPPAPGTTCSPRSATTCCAAAPRTEAREVVGRGDHRRPPARTTGECLAQAAAVWGSVTVWNWRPHGVVDDDMVALLEDLLAGAGAPTTTATTARLLGTLGVELAFGPDDRGVQAARAGRRDGPADRRPRAARPHAEQLLPRRLGPAGRGRAAAGRGRRGAGAWPAAGLPRRTEFVARLHRAADPAAPDRPGRLRGRPRARRGGWRSR